MSLIDLSGLDKYVKTYKPSNFETVMYMFWDKGIDYKQFCSLPLPYIFGILKTAEYVQQEEEKAYKKAKMK